MSKHTPGPWSCFNDEVLDANGRVIAHILTSQYEVGANVACDARLIAAAPDLLEALELARLHLDLLYPTGLKDNDFLCRTVNDAIAKAKGE